MTRVLVIHPREEERERIVSGLKGAGFQVASTEGWETALKKLYETQPQIIIMAEDLGVDSCARMREICNIPIIVLGGGDELARVAMLETGADVYLVEPVSLKELVARAHSLLRRYPRHEHGNPGIDLDPETKSVEFGNNSIPLTPTEFRLISCLVLNKGKVIPYSGLISEVWGQQVGLDTLHLYVRRLKEKLGIDSVGPYRLLCYRGQGYCFVAGGGQDSTSDTYTPQS